ncbi:MAG: hypothetical protein ABIG29_00905 [Candidatus Nealsonbacteria bacterium]
MRNDFEKALLHSEPAEPPAGLFDRIILAIKREQELRRTRRLVFGFAGLLVVSFAAVPFSWNMLVNQIESSGISYFISAAVGDLGTFFSLWQDFSLAVLESLPLTGMIAFAASLGIAVFTLRLFLYRKRLLLNYLISYEYK